jgi:hypothetical protein
MSVLSTADAVPALRRAYDEGRLVPFVGAGFSMPLRLPSWAELIHVLGAELGFEPDLFELHGDYAQLAGYFERVRPDARRWLVDWMRARFHRDEAETLRKTSVQHRALAALDWRTLYTTNYDQHIERALGDAGKPAASLARLDDFSQPYPAGTCQVIKFHGDIDAPETLVLTEDAYFHRLSLESAVDQRLRADLLSQHFLFIGYSFRDVNIRYIWHRMDQMRQSYQRAGDGSRAPLRCYMATFGAGHVQPDLLAVWNIDVIELDPFDRSQSVAELLSALA